MNLADKIMCLRKQHSWSQEELANKLSVSRQSVSKWEGNQATPEMDKIVMLSDIFNVSTDFLLKDDLSNEQENINVTTKQLETINMRSSEVDRYFKDYKEFAHKISIGVMLCILGVAGLIFSSAVSEMQSVTESSSNTIMGFGLICLLGLVAIAVYIFIKSTQLIDQYEGLDKQIVSLDQATKVRVKRQMITYRKDFKGSLAASVVIIILAVVPLILSGIMELDSAVIISFASLMLVIIAFSVRKIVNGSIISDSYNAIIDNKSKRKNKVEDKIESVYWPIVVAIYLGWSFLTYDWHITWIIWPIAGVLSEIIPVVAQSLHKRG